MLRNALDGTPINQRDAEHLLSLPEDSTAAALLRAAGNYVTRKRFSNAALLLGQVGVDMAPCDGGCAFCAFAKPHTTVEPSTLSTEEVVARCVGFARGGAQGVFIMTMHRFGFDWFLNLCASVRKSIPAGLHILANVGDLELNQLVALREAGVSGAYHVCRLREGVDTRLSPAQRRAAIERILEAGLDWYNSCEPIGPEHTAPELAKQIWLGVEMPCRQHAAMRRFPVPGSPLYAKGQISLARLAQIVAVIALATLTRRNLASIAVHESNVIGLLSGANALYPELGEPRAEERDPHQRDDGFTSALWRQSKEITTADCRAMLALAGFGLGPGTHPVLGMEHFGGQESSKSSISPIQESHPYLNTHLTERTL
jgi:biotin synthase